MTLDLFILPNKSALEFKKWKNLKQIVFKCGSYDHGLIDILARCPLLKHLKISNIMHRQFEDELKFADIKIEVLPKVSRALDENYYFINFESKNQDLLNNAIDFYFSL